MRSAIFIILHALAARAHVKELAAHHTNDTQDSMDLLAGKLIDKLVDRAIGSLGSNADMEDTTLAKAQVITGGSQLTVPQGSIGYRPPIRVEAMRSSLMQPTTQDKMKMYGIGSSPLANFAVTAINANNRENRRDFSLKAVQKEIVSGWSEVDSDTKRKLSRVLKEVKAKESVLAGITAPAGYFDPLGFATTVTAGKLLFYREVELKHGRVAMLAALGFLVGEQFHPLFGGDIDVPSYLAFQQTPLENFWPAVVAAIAIPEIFSVFTFQDPAKGEMWAMKEDHVPGDLGFDPLGLKPKDPKEFKTMQTKELNNGRLAMIAAAGMIAQEIATGQKLF